MRRAVAGDQWAWQEIVNRYSARVYRRARKAGLQDADAAEIVQQVFVAVVHALPRFRRNGQVGGFRAWLSEITRHKVVDAARAQSHGEKTGLVDVPYERADAEGYAPEVSVSPEREAYLARLRDAIARVRDRCSDQSWRIFWRVMADGQCPKDVAQEFGVPPHVVHLVKFRLSKYVRDELTANISKSLPSDAAQ